MYRVYLSICLYMILIWARWSGFQMYIPWQIKTCHARRGLPGRYTPFHTSMSQGIRIQTSRLGVQMFQVWSSSESESLRSWQQWQLDQWIAARAGAGAGAGALAPGGGSVSDTVRARSRQLQQTGVLLFVNIFILIFYTHYDTFIFHYYTIIFIIFYSF